MLSDHKEPREYRLGQALSSIPIPVRVPLMGLAYFLCALLANGLSFKPGPFINFWLPSGLYVAMLLSHEKRDWPLVVLGAFLGNIGIDLFNGQKIYVSFLFFSGNTFEALAGAWLVRRYVGETPILGRVRNVLALLGFSALLSTTLSATIGTIVVTAFFGVDAFKITWLLWWSGDMMGILLLAPIILSLFSPVDHLRLGKLPARLVEWLGTLLLMSVTAIFVFQSDLHGNFTLHYLVIPLVIWPALRFGPSGAAIGNLTVSLISTWVLVHGKSDFFRSGIPLEEQVASLQMFLVVLSLVSLLSAALLAERKLAEKKLHNKSEILENEVVQRQKVQESLAAQKDQLEKLNQSLEERINATVAEIREKDRMITIQSRQAAMGEMINSIAHQWRQPLNSLGLVLCNIKDSFDHQQLNRETLDQAVVSADRLIKKMSTTISDFSEFFRPSKERVSFSARKQVEEALLLVEAGFKGTQISIDVDGSVDLTLLGFPNEFSQVLLILLSNAKDAILEHRENGGEIRICLAGNDSQGQVIVEDNGGGIPAEIMDHLFDPYFSTKKLGSGIGLYLSKIIVERNMSGRLTAANIPGGARFTISTPLSPTDGAPA